MQSEKQATNRKRKKKASRIKSNPKAEKKPKRPPRPTTLLVIDGSYLSYRSYYAVTQFCKRAQDPKLSEQAREAILVEETCRTMLSMARRIINRNGPSYCVIVFDDNRTQDTFRFKLHDGYKAGRRKKPLHKDAFKVFKRMFGYYGVHCVDIPEGYEADDVIGTIITKFKDDVPVLKIYSGDRDFTQLVDDKTTLLYPNGGKSGRELFMTPAVVEEVMGVRPELIVPYKALVGDKSDGYSGVPSIGEKTAINLLNRFSTIEELYANLDKVKKGVRTKLEKGRDRAFLCNQLAQIVTDLDIDMTLESIWLDRHANKDNFNAKMMHLKSIVRSTLTWN